MTIAQRNAIKSAIKTVKAKRIRCIWYAETYGLKAKRPLKGHRI